MPWCRRAGTAGIQGHDHASGVVIDVAVEHRARRLSAIMKQHEVASVGEGLMRDAVPHVVTR